MPRGICFASEPTQVSAVSLNTGLATLAEIDETTAATLRFGNDRVATFVTSFNASDVACVPSRWNEGSPPRRSGL